MKKGKKNLLHFLFPPNVDTVLSKHGRDHTATTDINPSNLNKTQKNEIKQKYKYLRKETHHFSEYAFLGFLHISLINSNGGQQG